MDCRSELFIPTSSSFRAGNHRHHQPKLCSSSSWSHQTQITFPAPCTTPGDAENQSQKNVVRAATLVPTTRQAPAWEINIWKLLVLQSHSNPQSEPYRNFGSIFPLLKIIRKFYLDTARADRIPHASLLTDLLAPGRRNAQFPKSARVGRQNDTRGVFVPQAVLNHG